MAKLLAIFTAILILLISWNVIRTGKTLNTYTKTPTAAEKLNIVFMRSQNFPGSEITIEETLTTAETYDRYIVSFYSEGLKEYAFLTVPKGKKPAGGFPVIILNHGYVIPEKYTPDGNYVPHVDALSKAGYIVFKPDYRGNGKSGGSPGSVFFSPDYAIDVLNAIASVKKYPDANPEKIGVWGHSIGGNIALRVSEVSSDIKAVVIWSGVTGNYNDILYNWQNRVSYIPNAEDLYLRYLGSQSLLASYGTPDQNPDFWGSVDPTENLDFINVPVQIHVGMSDPQIPPDFSKSLYEKLKSRKKNVVYFEYPGANHDINESFTLAMRRTVEFFNRYLK